MAEQLIDGTGTGSRARIKNNRLYTLSISETIAEAAARAGDSYNVNTGVINLTSANKSAVFYLKNNGATDIAILTIGFLLGNSTGGTGDLKVDVVLNPTAGTIVSGALAPLIQANKNAGSSKSLTLDVYKGAEASTITDGSPWYDSLLAGAARPYVIATGSIILPKGSSVGVNITPQASNTSMDCEIFLSLIEDNF